MIDGDVGNGIWGNVLWAGKKNTAVVATRIDHPVHDTLEIEIHTSGAAQHNVGCFRLSVSEDPSALVRERKRNAATKLTDACARLGAAYALAGDTRQAADLLAKSGGGTWVASGLESGLSIDEVLDSMQARHPEGCAQPIASLSQRRRRTGTV